SKLRLHTVSDRFRNFGRGAEETRAAGDVRESLVDRDAFDERREITDDLYGGVTQPLVLFEMAADKNELRTKLACPPSRHPAMDSEGLGFVGGGKHDPAAHRDRLAAQRGVEQLFDRGIERIQVRVENGGGCFHPAGFELNSQGLPSRRFSAA